MKMPLRFMIGWPLSVLVVPALLALTSCEELRKENADAQHAQDAMTARKNDLDAQIAKKGYAVVGKTPAGQPIYMIYVSAGWDTDRVYFTDPSMINAAVSTSRCGKNCITKGVTIR